MQSVQLGCTSQMLLKTYDCQIYCLNQLNQTCLLYNSNKQLIRFNYKLLKTLRSIQWVNEKKKKIFHIAYSPVYYFVLCEDWKIYFLSPELTILNHHQFQTQQYISLIIMQYYINNKSEHNLLMVSTNSLAVYKVFLKDKIPHLLINKNLEGSLEYNKSMKVIENILIIYNMHEVSLWNVVDYSHISKLKFQVTISDVYVINKQLIIGDSMGCLMIYSLDGSLQHFIEKAHEGMILAILVVDEKIYTVGNDIQLKLWNYGNIVALEQIYALNMQKINYFKFINGNNYLINSANYLYLTQLNHQLQTLHSHNSGVSAASNKCISFKNHIYYSITEQTNIFVPNHSVKVQQIIDSPYEENVYYLNLQNQILSKWINDHPIQLYNYQQIRTINGDQLNQEVSYIAFLPFEPPLFDAEVTFDQKDRMTVKKIFGDNPKQFMALGCQKGALVIVNLEHFQLIYFRINYNKTSIIYLGSIKNIIIIVSQDFTINFVNLKPELVQSVKIPNLGPLLTIKDHLMIGQLSRIYIFNSEQLALNTQIEHESEILGISASQNFVLSYSLTQIKIWNLDGINIYNIQMHTDLDYVQMNGEIGSDSLSLLLSLEGFLCKMNIPLIQQNIQTSEYDKINLNFLMHDFNKPRTPKMNQVNFELKSEMMEQSTQSKTRIQYQQIKEKGKQHEKRVSRNLSQSVVIQTSKQYSDKNCSLDTSSQQHSFMLPAIPRVINKSENMLTQFIQSRMKKGAPKNRREWTRDKIIMANILKQMD